MPLPGATELLSYRQDHAGVPLAIATSGYAVTACRPRTTRAAGGHPDGDPGSGASGPSRTRDLFLAAAACSSVEPRHAWSSATACGTFWPPSGPARWVLVCSRAGYGRAELERPGRTGSTPIPADMLDHLEEVGVRAAT